MGPHVVPDGSEWCAAHGSAYALMKGCRAIASETAWTLSFELPLPVAVLAVPPYPAAGNMSMQLLT